MIIMSMGETLIARNSGFRFDIPRIKYLDWQLLLLLLLLYYAQPAAE